MIEIQKRKRASRYSDSPIFKFMIKYEMGQKDFSILAGISQTYLNILIRKNIRPSWKFMLKIYKATNGEVAPNDFL